MLEIGHVHPVLVDLGGLQGGFVDQILQVGPGRNQGCPGPGRRAARPGKAANGGCGLRGCACGRARPGSGPPPADRPGRNNAGSSTSGQLVAAIKITPSLDSKPSISTSSWLSVLFALVMAAAKAGPALPAHSVDFVNENEARSVFLALQEQVADPGRANAHEHFHKIGTGNGEKRHPRPRRPQPGPAGSCRCPANRPAARPWVCVRPGG